MPSDRDATRFVRRNQGVTGQSQPEFVFALGHFPSSCRMDRGCLPENRVPRELRGYPGAGTAQEIAPILPSAEKFSVPSTTFCRGNIGLA